MTRVAPKNIILKNKIAKAKTSKGGKGPTPARGKAGKVIKLGWIDLKKVTALKAVSKPTK